MTKFTHLLLVLMLMLLACKKNSINTPGSFSSVESYFTTFDQSYKFARIETEMIGSKEKGIDLLIDSSQKFQTMDGFGYSLTGGSAQHLQKLAKDQREDLLIELFGDEAGSIGVSYLRISLGASDLDEKAFSYNDIDPETEDLNLDKFSLKEDENDLIPILKEILAINPNIGIMASPWSPPTWMKTNKSTKGGSLKPEYYDVYAQYFVKYIKAMSGHGIHIDAITIQNEPLHPGNNPSLLMTPEAQAEFIKRSLGPAFEKEKVDTKIVIYDHNADRIDYPMTVFNDSEANRYIDGAAFHLYGGEIENLQELHNAHPNRNLYFTEQWIGSPGNFEYDFRWHMKNLIIGAPRNWCKTVLEWNLASGPYLQPHTDGGCTECLGALTINGDEIIRNPAYYIIAHASKFVTVGSTRIFSTELNDLPNVAYITPEDDIVLIALNESEIAKSVTIELAGSSFNYLIEPSSAATYIFHR